MIYWSLNIVESEFTMEVQILPDSLSRHVFVRLSGRRFPGVVVQGDTLAAWRFRIDQAASKARLIGDAALESLLAQVERQFDELLSDYNDVCRRHGYQGLGKDVGRPPP